MMGNNCLVLPVRKLRLESLQPKCTQNDQGRKELRSLDGKTRALSITPGELPFDLWCVLQNSSGLLSQAKSLLAHRPVPWKAVSWSRTGHSQTFWVLSGIPFFWTDSILSLLWGSPRLEESKKQNGWDLGEALTSSLGWLFTAVSHQRFSRCKSSN